MKLIVGLGNPGKEYEKTRHNSGFMAIDRAAEQLGICIETKNFEALLGKTNVNGTVVLLAKPLTYMNESGRSVSQVVKYYHIAKEDILILHDDMDLPVGTVRIRKNGSSGGQKGMKSIQQALGTQEIARIRIGVGHSARGEHELVPDWVLSPVSKAEWPVFSGAIEDAAQAAVAWISEPFDLVMSRYNIRKAEEQISNIQK